MLADILTWTIWKFLLRWMNFVRFCKRSKDRGAFREQYELSFNAHLNLVTIHPWVVATAEQFDYWWTTSSFVITFFLLRYSKRIGKNISFLYANVRTKKPTSRFCRLWQGSWRNRFLWRLKGLKLRKRKDSVLCSDIILSKELLFTNLGNFV